MNTPRTANYQLERLNTPDYLRGIVPSIFETCGSEKTSALYRPIPTFEIVQALWSSGWLVTKAQQSKSRLGTHAKHLLRFRHVDSPAILNGVHPEIVLVNSHDGSSAYQLRGGEPIESAYGESESEA